ncbi:hypothetical protein [Synechococcus sp. CC9311]|uniref:hypothetical protein n=1 Tax=Synechococcus sp. (strain CC9311) TaxID=64471 RepID=UPI0003242ED4|nr:hypothetical protein [Synechococcus sp. CC9311]
MALTTPASKGWRSNAAKSRTAVAAVWHGVIQHRQLNAHADHLAGLAGVRDCWNPELGGMR